MEYIETIVNLDGSTTKREYTADEISEMQFAEIKVAQRQVELETKAAEKAALLAKLGITKEEAALLLG